METKKCANCGQELPLSEFNRCAKNRDGLMSYCKGCQAVKGKAYARTKAIAKYSTAELLEEINKRGIKLIKPMSPREMMQSLANQGYKGTLTFTKIETININEL